MTPELHKAKSDLEATFERMRKLEARHEDQILTLDEMPIKTVGDVLRRHQARKAGAQ